MSFLYDIKVVYGDEPSEEPSDSIEVIDSASGDINQGFKGKYVWLVPKYGSYPDCTGITIIIQRDEDIRYSDLGKYTGGNYRYLHFKTGGRQSVGKVALARSDREIDSNWVERYGWDAYSSDIHEGRHGSYLYIVWKWV
ncbi:hypothetical protein PENNAL_c0032G08705 [Penicillium nalgiovense]|uniref:Uncharacterized protein n=1 Tax=Penicillium nalgiovense TaxID=60175 RepID=A0A1V6Y7J5_PENNA|nr:hypothetical protein PENNAL_c0032G08705 [Penicillium nalgiovense]